jgi:putative transposase
VDNGSEFVSRDLDLWAYAKGVTLDFSRPGKPTDNACIEAFNGRFRAERLNAHWFLTLADAAEKMEAWRRDYNEVRPRGAIGHGADFAVKRSCAAGKRSKGRCEADELGGPVESVRVKSCASEPCTTAWAR